MEEYGFGIIFLFFSFLLVGLFFVIATVMLFFQSAFAEARKLALAQKVRNETRALACAFLVLDKNDGGALCLGEFQQLLERLDETTVAPLNTTDFIESIANELRQKTEAKLQDDADDKAAAIKFIKLAGGGDKLVKEAEGKAQTAVMAVNLAKQIVFTDEQTRASEMDFKMFAAAARRTQYLFMVKPALKWQSCRDKLQNIVETKAFDHLRLWLVCGYTFIMMLYGTYEETIILDQFCQYGLLAMVLEVGIVMFAYGPLQFFLYGQFNPDLKYQSIGNTADFILVLLTVGADNLLSRYPGYEAYPHLRAVLSLPVLRLLTRITKTRKLIAVMMSIIPTFAPLLTMLFSFEAIFMIVGVTLMQGQLDKLEDPVDQSFDSFTQAFMVLVELFIGDEWTGTMFAAVLVTTWATSFYFLIHTFLVVIILTQLIMGMMLDALKTLWDADQESKVMAVDRKIFYMKMSQADNGVSWTNQRISQMVKTDRVYHRMAAIESLG